MRSTLPSIITRFFCTLGIHERFVRFLAWETLCPKLRCLPVIAHFISLSLSLCLAAHWRAVLFTVSLPDGDHEGSIRRRRAVQRARARSLW